MVNMLRPENLRWLTLIVFGFISGGVMYSRFLPRLFLKKDICELSPDKNPGSANVFVNCGVPMGILCLFLDMFKGFLPVFIAVMTLDIHDIRFAALMAASVLGHAVAPFDHFRGGKCIATAFGEMIALLPVSRIGLGLAGLYIFFSTVWKINPNRVRSIVVFGLFGLGSGVWFWLQKEPAMLIGCLCISATAILKHSRWLTALSEKTAKAEAEKRAESL